LIPVRGFIGPERFQRKLGTDSMSDEVLITLQYTRDDLDRWHEEAGGPS
jgi:hypothetical protein